MTVPFLPGSLHITALRQPNPISSLILPKVSHDLNIHLGLSASISAIHAEEGTVDFSGLNLQTEFINEDGNTTFVL